MIYDNYALLKISPRKARFKVVRMDLDLFSHMMFGAEVVEACSAEDGSVRKELRAAVVSGLPEDAEVQAICFDPMSREVLLRVWSNEFEEVPHGAEAPRLELTFTRWFAPILTPEEHVNLTRLRSSFSLKLRQLEASRTQEDRSRAMIHGRFGPREAMSASGVVKSSSQTRLDPLCECGHRAGTHSELGGCYAIVEGGSCADICPCNLFKAHESEAARPMAVGADLCNPQCVCHFDSGLKCGAGECVHAEAVSLPTNPPPPEAICELQNESSTCTCEIGSLMTAGCTCGAIKR